MSWVTSPGPRMKRHPKWVERARLRSTLRDAPEPVMSQAVVAVWPGHKPLPRGELVSVRPRVRLSKVVHVHARAIEILRYVKRNQPCSVETLDATLELIRRGVLDRVDHIWRDPKRKHRLCLTDKGKRLVRAAMDVLEITGLLISVGIAPMTRARTLFLITPDGEATLADWDDPAADGVYPTKL